jgi:hypothetical protein
LLRADCGLRRCIGASPKPFPRTVPQFLTPAYREPDAALRFPHDRLGE